MVKKLLLRSIYIFLFITINTTFVHAQINDEDSVVTEEEAEAEDDDIDDNFTGYTDLNYWDFLRIPNFKFDTNMIPASNYYPFGWDTITINPYKQDLKEMSDTFFLHLKDSHDCMFHPPAIGELSSNFGFRQWGRKKKFHFGVDVHMETGDPVYCIFDGVVRVAKRSADYGYVVLIRHYNGLETLYAHFSQLLTYTGAPVRSGDIIGLAGSTGRSTGPHLHFEVRFKGEKIDPNKIIYFPLGSLLDDTLQIDRSCFKHLYEVQANKLKQSKSSGRYYKTRKGDTLAKVAYSYGISVKHLARINKISTKSKLKPGQRIRVR
jgi:murein DD-endopeptidase MepM/ murein hydrolase activator NlpD